MKIGVLGTGNMGRTLGSAWASLGHSVYFGSRQPEKAQAVAEAIGQNAQGGSNEQAATFGDVILQTARSLPTEFLTDSTVLVNKILIDCNNRSIPEDFHFGPPPLPSFAEQLATNVPGVRVVKALNTMAQEIFNHPADVLRQHQVACYLAGDDPEAKQLVAQLTAELGFDAIDCGPLSHAWMLEAAGDLIRYVIMHEQKGPYATFAVPVLPAAEARFGGRQASSYR